MAKTVAERGRDFTARAKVDGRLIVKVRLTKKASANARAAKESGETYAEFINRAAERTR